MKPTSIEGPERARGGMVARTSGLWSRLRREPLLVFILIGAFLCAADRLSAASAHAKDSPRLIAVDREALLRFLQYRSKVFSDEGAGRSFDAMTEGERKQLIDSYVREEALYREAVSLGLDKQDYVVRRRLVQSLEFALQDDQAAPVAAEEAALRRFYAANRRLYAMSPTISFRHAFFRHGPEATTRARSALTAIRSAGAEPASLGDRFLYQTSYAGQSLDSVARDFGRRFATALFSQRAASGWLGPLVSDHGLHLVQVMSLEPGGVPPFELVRDKVAADAAEALRRERQEGELQRIVARYQVAIAPGAR